MFFCIHTTLLYQEEEEKKTSKFNHESQLSKRNKKLEKTKYIFSYRKDPDSYFYFGRVWIRKKVAGSETLGVTNTYVPQFHNNPSILVNELSEETQVNSR